jgi:hypothetical protein
MIARFLGPCVVVGVVLVGLVLFTLAIQLAHSADFIDAAVCDSVLRWEAHSGVKNLAGEKRYCGFISENRDARTPRSPHKSAPRT